jgi:mono/diheme cytochrome c family protein
MKILLKSVARCTASVSLALGVVSLGACRGQQSEEPPIHPNLNMDFQTNFKAQEENSFFADGRAQRPQVPGTVARGQLHENEELSYGKTGSEFVRKIPVNIDKSFIERGQERYNIYCTPCHGKTGDGNSIIVKRGMLKPPNFHDQRIVDMAEGEIYGAIINGVRGNMPSYAYAIPVEDRWAIVAYVRALQLSQRASLDNVPGDIANSKGWTK